MSLSASNRALKTARLSLRFPEVSDAAELTRHYQLNQKAFALSGSCKPEYLVEAYWKQVIPLMRSEIDLDHSLRFLVFTDQGKHLIGIVNFTQIFRGAFQACYLGYSLDHSHQGKGIMTEALRAAIDYAFQERNLHRIMANYLPENRASARVLEKLGFVVEGSAKDYLYLNEQWRDHTLTSLSNPNWKPQN
jgi:ribosomal-protein-alanine N-acetyltransferase